MFTRDVHQGQIHRMTDQDNRQGKPGMDESDSGPNRRIGSGPQDGLFSRTSPTSRKTSALSLNLILIGLF
jgi:hypothetical protein